MKNYILADMTWPEVEDALKTVEVAIIPVGAQEQHGPHLAEGCDSYRVERFCGLLAEKCFPNVIVAPTINYGISPHHLGFPGTISLQPETLISLLDDIVFSLKESGLKKFLFVNGHGGNSAAIAVAADKIARKYDVSIAHTKFIDAASEVIKKEIKSPIIGHACEREISESLYLAPEIVRIDSISKGDENRDSFAYKHFSNSFVKVVYEMKELTNSGNIGDGRLGSYELGEKLINEALKNLSEFIDDFIKSK